MTRERWNLNEPLRDEYVPGGHCLGCGKQLDGASACGGRGPQPGDTTICIYCGHLMAFADDLTFRALTDAEMIEIAGDPDVLLIQRLRAAIKPKSDSKS